MSRSRPTTAAWLLLATALVLVPGCSLPGRPGGDPVVPSGLEPTPVRTPPGPAYTSRPIAADPPSTSVVVADSTAALRSASEADWLPDGRLLVQRTSYERSGPDLGVTGTRAQLVDPATGAVERAVRGDLLADWGVTPEAITARFGNRLVIYSPDLTGRRVVEVDASSVRTDQAEGPDAEFSMFGRAYTLDGVTWVQWGVNSEDDTRTDHGVLRIEGGRVDEVLRNQPVVSLVPGRDGAALLALMQDNGADESCGGCVVEQKVVELDPATGEVAADYGMPDGYDRSWRVEALDRIGAQVVVRFAIGEAETRADPGVLRATWVYDGRWRHLEDLDGTRTTWQDGGRLVWTQLQARRDEGEGAAYRLEWVPDGGPTEVLLDGASGCRRNRGAVAVPRGALLCPLIDAPGSLLPPG